ncbi:hypothetical protein ABFA25_07405 [Mycobacterium lepromatosis]|uniref:hypothetical protein n=1 Tax=Mycobacterium lepromatosis TaxID=480418 RepID=UPI001EDB5FDB|nr:hypothetical protein [Mycobacterium lepromatosis]
MQRLGYQDITLYSWACIRLCMSSGRPVGLLEDYPANPAELAGRWWGDGGNFTAVAETSA